MRAIVSISLSLGMILGPFAQAQSTKTSSDSAKIYATQVGTYTKAKSVYAQKGAQAFVATYGTLLSRADSQYMTTQLSSTKIMLPTLVPTSKGFDLTSSGVTVSFDLTHMDDGYVLVGGKRVTANFGGSLEEISIALEKVLKQTNPAQFGKELSAGIADFFVTKAYAANNAVIWGALAAIVGALIFKGVYDANTAKKKKEAAKKPAYVTEPAPAAPRSNSTSSGGGPVLDYGSRTGPHNPNGVIPPRPAATGQAATGTVEEVKKIDPTIEPSEDPPLNPPPAPPASQQPSPPAVAEVGNEDYQSYKAAFCSQDTRDSISSIMQEILKEHGESKGKIEAYAYFSTQRNGNFREAGKTFLNKVLTKMEQLRSQPERKGLYDAYVSFVNKNIKPKPAIEAGKVISAEDMVKMINEINNRRTVYATFAVNPGFKADATGKQVPNPEKSFIGISFDGGSPVINYNLKDSAILWGVNDISTQRELCKGLKFGAAVPSSSAPVTPAPAQPKTSASPLIQHINQDNLNKQQAKPSAPFAPAAAPAVSPFTTPAKSSGAKPVDTTEAPPKPAAANESSKKSATAGTNVRERFGSTTPPAAFITAPAILN